MGATRSFCLGIALLAVIALPGCGVGPNEDPAPSTIDPVRTVTALPTPDRLIETTPAGGVDAAALEVALFGPARENFGGSFARRGLLRAATRRWRFSGPGGGELFVAVSVWRDRGTATTVGGAAAEQLLRRDGAGVWSPGELRGVRGAELVRGAVAERTLARAVNQNGLFVRSSGGVPPDVTIRAMTRLSNLAQADAPG